MILFLFSYLIHLFAFFPLQIITKKFNIFILPHFLQLAKEKEIYSAKLSDERIHNEQSFQDFKSAAIKRQVGPRSVD